MTDNSAADVIAYLKSLGLGAPALAKLERLARDKGITLEALLTNNFPGWRSSCIEEDHPTDPTRGAANPTDH